MAVQHIAGKFDFLFRLWRFTLASVKGTFSINVLPAPPPPLALAGNFPDETMGSPASGGVAATGGVPPYSYGVTAGALPPGISLDPLSGQLNGSPTDAGVANFEVTATDSGA